MTQTSMDVGNIISVIIPESPDTNINIDQLTADFKRKLERIRKQSHTNKFEDGLVTLKSALPEMSKDEKKKAIPLIRRMMQEKKNSQRVKTNNQRKLNSVNQRKNIIENSRRNAANSAPRIKNEGFRKSLGTGPSQSMKEKYRKKNKKPVLPRENYQQSEKIDDSTWSNPVNTERLVAKNPIDFNDEKNQQYLKDNWEYPDGNRPYSKSMSPKFSCADTYQDDDYKVRNPKEVNKSELSRDSQVSSVIKDEYDSSPSIIPISLEIDDLKGFERILKNPDDVMKLVNETYLNQQQIPAKNFNQYGTIQSSNSNGYYENNPNDFKSSSGYYEINHDTTQSPETISDQADYQTDMLGRQQANFDNEKVEIRIQRSVKDDLHLKKNPHFQYIKTKKNHSSKLKKPWKSYPRSWKKNHHNQVLKKI